MIAIAGLSLLYLALLPPLLAWMIGWPQLARIAVSLALLAPIAFFMGMPFPLGLTRVSEAAAALVPWAWGVNGCASVISAVLALILAIHFGFAAVVAIAVVLYALAATAFRKPLAE